MYESFPIPGSGGRAGTLADMTPRTTTRSTTRSSGARGTLSTAALVDRALAIADAEGLEALTIRRLATEHGVTPMAIYWHFSDKEAILGALAERLLSQVDLGSDEPAPPEALEAFLRAFVTAIRPHPAAASLVVDRLLDSEAGLAVADHGLGLLREAGLDQDRAAELGKFMLSALVTLVTSEPGPRRTLEPRERAAEVRERKAQLSALDPERFSQVIASADALADCQNEDRYFGIGTDLILAGVRALTGAGR
jgi:TetR/AcrR family transcriptional regulator, tetracycline repressor protein